MADDPKWTELLCPVCQSTHPAEMKEGLVTITCTTCGSEYTLNLVPSIVREYSHFG